MTVSEFKSLLDTWVGHSWLSNHDFSCEDKHIEQGINVFWKDYLRWFPDDYQINLDKLNETPQLIAMLLYRIAREIHLNNTLSNSYGGGGKFFFIVSSSYRSDRNLLFGRYRRRIKD